MTDLDTSIKKLMSNKTLRYGLYLFIELDNPNKLKEALIIDANSSRLYAPDTSFITKNWDIFLTNPVNYNFVLIDPDNKSDMRVASYEKMKNSNNTLTQSLIGQMFKKALHRLTRKQEADIKRIFGEGVVDAAQMNEQAPNENYEEAVQQTGEQLKDKDKVLSKTDGGENANLGLGFNASTADTALNKVKEQIPDIEDIANLDKVRDQIQNDVAIGEKAAEYLLQFRNKGEITNKEQIDKLNNIQEYLTNRYEVAILDAIDTDENKKNEIIQNYFAQKPNPNMGNKKIRSVVDFGRMNPKNKLKLLYSKTSNMQNLMNLMYSNQKAIFSKSLVTEKGCRRFAKANNATFAPVTDYDGDGVKDYLIYDKNGKLIAVNGWRLKKDDKHALKRLFYQTVPDPKMQKAMGGFEGWLNTELFQVGPYNHLGEREVRVPKKTMQLLNQLRKTGYLSKKAESYLPRTKKSFATTVKGHIGDAIRWAFYKLFPDKTKCVNHLPLTPIAEYIYKIVIGSEMSQIAKKYGQWDNITGQLNNYVENSKKSNPTVNQLYKLLSQFISSDDSAKKELHSQLPAVLTHVVPYSHYVALYYVCEGTKFPHYADTAPTDADFNQESQRTKKAAIVLTEMRELWKKEIKNIFNKVMPEFFGNITIGNFKAFADEHRQAITDAHFKLLEPYTVKETEATVIRKDGIEYHDFQESKYEDYNVEAGEKYQTPNWLFNTQLTRYEGQKNASNQHLLNAGTYRNTLNKALKSVRKRVQEETTPDGKRIRIQFPTSSDTTAWQTANTSRLPSDGED